MMRQDAAVPSGRSGERLASPPPHPEEPAQRASRRMGSPRTRRLRPSRLCFETRPKGAPQHEGVGFALHPITLAGPHAPWRSPWRSTPTLERKLESFVRGLVASGRYPTSDEVLREAVRLFQEREATLAALDAAISRGLADVAAGRAAPAAEVFDALEAKYQAMADATGE